jgi:GT2 family glycosyltransferase
VDDGSTDGTAAILEDFASDRLRVLRLDANRGLTNALNAGLALCRGRYVARMDADDEATPDRLASQIALMDERPEVAACGAWMIRVDANGGEELWRAPVDHEGVVSEMLFRSPLAHPTAMLRKHTLDSHGIRYDPSFSCAQDYDLWLRLSRVGELANIGQVLLRLHLHEHSISACRRPEQDECARRVRRVLLRELGLAPTAAHESLHERIINLHAMDGGELDQAAAWLETLDAHNRTARRFPPRRFAKVLRAYLKALAERSPDHAASQSALRRPLAASDDTPESTAPNSRR